MEYQPIDLKQLMQFIEIYSIIARKIYHDIELDDLDIEFLSILEEYDFILDKLKKED